MNDVSSLIKYRITCSKLVVFGLDVIKASEVENNLSTFVSFIRI